MSHVRDEIVDLEKRFWEADPDFYEDAIEEDAVIVMEPAGFLAKEKAKEIAGKTKPWTEVSMNDVNVQELTPDCATIAYHGEGKREGENPTRSSVASTYVRRNGRWRLAMTSHQPWPRPGA